MGPVWVAFRDGGFFGKKNHCEVQELQREPASQILCRDMILDDKMLLKWQGCWCCKILQLYTLHWWNKVLITVWELMQGLKPNNCLKTPFC